jgi:hypothetical protein
MVLLDPGIKAGDPFAFGVLTFLVMLVALLLPIKAFFWKSANLEETAKQMN